ncbi:MAG: hypothetical protein ACO3DQ_04995, partial [Cephaloticoccus sp.]
PEFTLLIVDDVDAAVALCNEHSPHFVVSVLTEDADVLERVYRSVDAPFVGDTPLTTNGMKMARLQGLRAVRADFRGLTPPNPSVCVHGLRIGPVALLGCGLEVYHSLQAPVLAGSPHAHTWVISLVGGTGYAPDRAATERAGYAGDFVPLVTGELPYARVYDELPRALVKLARDLT